MEPVQRIMIFGLGFMLILLALFLLILRKTNDTKTKKVLVVTLGATCLVWDAFYFLGSAHGEHGWLYRGASFCLGIIVAWIGVGLIVTGPADVCKQKQESDQQ